MTTLKYKLFEAFLRTMKHRDRIFADLEKPRIGSARPKGKLAERFVQSKFKGRTVWTVHPLSGESQSRYVHFHGGAYVYRLIDIHFPTIAELADESGVTIVMPDYPIHPQNAQETHGWSHDYFTSVVQEHSLENVTIGGCSAGANLALAVLQMRRAEALQNPSDTILWSPWVDLTMTADAVPHNPKEALLSVRGIVASGERFIKDRDPKDPLISPIFAALKGLSEFHIFTGQKDLLYPQINAFADKAKEAGVLKTYKVEPDFGHYWMFYPTKDRHGTIRETAEILRQ
jgi:acetyl esterase/lipase